MTDSADSAHLPFDASTAARLLELLSNDDDFRDCFQCNPAQALAQIGVAGTSADKSVPGAGEPYYCMTTNQLASKEDIALARAELQSYLTEKTNHTVIFAFESESIRSTLLRK
ncbi:NHLP-related RiPP peptide [Xanthomonas oryzae]|uniref:NHLP-related RiPP peptide n=1 Tax=Xanthomonas oryzae pv. leersiae TaxID=3112258 RepID=A0AAJ6KN99_9XANT|nr:NHLP-related RiPP peptide [Xanthomonas oryzae]WIX06903.1 NHLP-related RiPP peptide [Xanthomonas oryzae pv. oryzae]QBG86673.1 putative modified peptide [Xanthomonas oryzae]QBG97516.1 putative modified peptide [Xanthomonas oryzae]QBG98401.1 putative modified peptide [Xanthomonas oryzae]QBH05335.1 putative modified peptide [Xanthomonas oryzae]